jgi:hypothetical protein
METVQGRSETSDPAELKVCIVGISGKIGQRLLVKTPAQGAATSIHFAASPFASSTS